MTSSIENYSSANNPAPPRYLGSRYNSAGEFLPDPGNTVVCHVVPGSRTEPCCCKYVGASWEKPAEVLPSPRPKAFI
jgi:hypothetical protein